MFDKNCNYNTSNNVLDRRIIQCACERPKSMDKFPIHTSNS